MTLQDEFAAAALQRAEQISTARVAKPDPQQARTDQGAEWLNEQFEALATEPAPEPKTTAPTPDANDVLNIFPKF